VWLLVHLVYMTGFKNRLSALAGWVIAFVGRDRRQRTITEREVFARTRFDDQTATRRDRDMITDRPPAVSVG
jgi:hypothetical protein